MNRIPINFNEKLKSIYSRVMSIAPNIADVLFETGNYQYYEVSKMNWDELIQLRSTITLSRFGSDEIRSFREHDDFSELDKELKLARDKTRTYAISKQYSGLTVRISNSKLEYTGSDSLTAKHIVALDPKYEDNNLVLSILYFDPRFSDKYEDKSKEFIEDKRLKTYLNIISYIINSIMDIECGISFDNIDNLFSFVTLFTSMLALHISVIYQLTGDRTIFTDTNIDLYIYNLIINRVYFNINDVDKVINKFLNLGCMKGFVDSEDDDSGFGEMCKLVQNYVV